MHHAGPGSWMRHWRPPAALLAAAAAIFVLVPQPQASASNRPGLDAQCNPETGRVSCAYHDLRGYAFVGTVTPLGEVPYRIRNGDFQGADLSGAKFDRVEVTNTNFVTANLAGAQFKGQSKLLDNDMFSANFSGAGFDTAAMQNDKLSSATFDRAVMVVSSFNDSNFTNARLVGTDLTSSDFIRANFTDATLQGAREGRVNVFFGWTNFDKAKFCNTVMPNGRRSYRDC